MSYKNGWGTESKCCNDNGRSKSLVGNGVLQKGELPYSSRNRRKVLCHNSSAHHPNHYYSASLFRAHHTNHYSSAHHSIYSGAYHCNHYLSAHHTTIILVHITPTIYSSAHHSNHLFWCISLQPLFECTSHNHYSGAHHSNHLFQCTSLQPLFWCTSLHPLFWWTSPGCPAVGEVKKVGKSRNFLPKSKNK